MVYRRRSPSVVRLVAAGWPMSVDVVGVVAEMMPVDGDDHSLACRVVGDRYPVPGWSVSVPENRPA